jgi:hypothetical protein
VDRKTLEQELASTGWEVDGSFSEHLAIGNAEDLSVIVPGWAEWGEDPVYELYDVERNVSYWVDKMLTPNQAAELLREHGKTPEE